MDIVDGSRVSPSLTTPLPLTKSRIEVDQAVRHNTVSQVYLYGTPIVALVIDGTERLCLAQISNTLLKDFSYNEIHNRRVALGITCVQCTPVQLEILRRAGAMPISSRRCGMITKREAERLCKSFLGDNRPPKLPDNFAFDVDHACAWGCRGSFVPSRYNSSRAKCIKCIFCSMFFSPNKFVFHSHRLPESKYVQPDAANFNSWRRHINLHGDPSEDVQHAWEDVKAMFNGGTRKRLMQNHQQDRNGNRLNKPPRISSSQNKSPPFSPPTLKALPTEVNLSNYNPYVSGITPLTDPYPSPVAQKALDMRQSFVDYLWGPRASLGPLGLSYPLAWPKRPLASLPSFGVGSSDLLEPPEVHSERLDLGLRTNSTSAFTPVNKPSTPPSSRQSSPSPIPGDAKAWSEDDALKDSKANCSWEDRSVLPDSSHLSDEEAVDIENPDDGSGKSLCHTTNSTGSPVIEKRPISPTFSCPDRSSPTQNVPSTSSELLNLSEPTNKRQKVTSTVSQPESSLTSVISTVPHVETPLCFLPDEDPRLRLFFLREVEARRRMEVEMAHLKYSYSGPHLPTPLHHGALRPSLVAPSVLHASQLHLSNKVWNDSLPTTSSPK